MLRWIPLMALLLLSLAGCRNLYEAPRPYAVYAKPASYFQPLENTPETPQEKAVTLVNKDYPIELQMYKDGRFHYYLARLGDGEGTWNYKDGHIEYYAERKIFVMRMQMHSVAPGEQESMSLEFSDRFGPKFLSLERKL